ncbi:hypothetical protein PV327_003718 [Microctonus hyperodae]|uniref:Tudor domain-containing protein n=1 Tax=Microctonus hyperodae TaxID=165561 RepID=A0AA39G5G4_MICHY|nr:hypothetical protein PV327_003718 [Microctonus hyperodae]
MADDNLLFVRGAHKNNHDQYSDDVWDDSVLIKAYDRAVSLAKDEVAKRLSLETDSSRTKSTKLQTPMPSEVNSNFSKKKWAVGSPCRAIYSVDGQRYEAIISKILKDSACIVKFVGYGNFEKVNLSSLEESDGLESQIAQQKDALASKTNLVDDNGVNNLHFNHQACNSNEFIDERMDYESDIPKHQKKNQTLSSPPFNPAFNMMPPAPPLPPQLIARLPESDDDALSSMLMSWYISGFHTGFYHGIKQAESSKNSRKKC